MTIHPSLYFGLWWLMIISSMWCSIEVYEWISNFLPHFRIGISTHPYWDYSYDMVVTWYMAILPSVPHLSTPLCCRPPSLLSSCGQLYDEWDQLYRCVVGCLLSCLSKHIADEILVFISVMHLFSHKELRAVTIPTLSSLVALEVVIITISSAAKVVIIFSQ